MSCLSWNCRGMGNLATVRVLQRLIKIKVPSIIFLMETKLIKSEMEKLRQKLNIYSFHVVDCDTNMGGRRGGICVLWNDTISLKILSDSTHHIDALVMAADNFCEWRLTGIYGWPEEHMKDCTWNLIKDLALVPHKEWICLGDFNQILYHHEKQGGVRRDDRKLEKFRDAIHACGLKDLGYSGFHFTWSNGQSGIKNVQERLDR